MHEFVEIDCKKNVTINIYVYVHVWSILSSTSFECICLLLFYTYEVFFDFRHAYPETTYITAGPAGTIGPITVSLFSL